MPLFRFSLNESEDCNEVLEAQILHDTALNSLLLAKKVLENCQAGSTPGTNDQQIRADNAVKQLQSLWAARQSQVALQPASSKKPRYMVAIRWFKKSPSIKSDVRTLQGIHQNGQLIHLEAQKTALRRGNYMTLYNIVGSQRLPKDAHECVSVYNNSNTSVDTLHSNKTVRLTKSDRVQLPIKVEILKASDLDSPKFRDTGPRLMKLAQKTVNFLIDSQENLYYEVVANCVHCHVVQLAHDMWVFPDDSEEHIRYMQAIENILNRLPPKGSVSQNQSEPALHVIQEYETEVESITTELKNRLSSLSAVEDNTPKIDIDHISLKVNGSWVNHEKKDLNWEYLRDNVLCTLKVQTLVLESFDEVSSQSGGFSQIHVGKLEGRKVGIKFLRMGDNNNKLDDKQKSILCVRFIRELYIWLKAGIHPHIQEINGLYFRDGIPAFVSPWCDGGDLYFYIHNGNGKAFSSSKRLYLAYQLCLGLQHLHSAEVKIVHGDIKTNNILIHNGIPKLHDFGISHVLDDALGLTTRLHGSDRYSAPEIIEARSNIAKSNVKILPGADIFSFARVLYECVTKEAPFQRTHISDVKALVLKQELPTYPDFGNWSSFKEPWKDNCEAIMHDCWRVLQFRPTADTVSQMMKQLCLKAGLEVSSP